MTWFVIESFIALSCGVLLGTLIHVCCELVAARAKSKKRSQTSKGAIDWRLNALWQKCAKYQRKQASAKPERIIVREGDEEFVMWLN